MDELSLLCPVCGGELRRTDKSYMCALGHCFDIARQGYVNLLTGSSVGRHGDDRLMVRSRAEFLDLGCYERLRSAVTELAVKYAPARCAVLDAGCGEGYYSAAVLDALSAAGKTAQLIGVDISKTALIYAARRSPRLRLTAASSAALPLGDGAVDVLLNIFSPFVPAEFHRVLKPGGTLIRVVPLQRHLWELKELVYERPYENPSPDAGADGFRLTESRELKYSAELKSNGEIMSLFKMTPYYYKTGMSDQEKAETADALTVSLEFGIYVYGRS